MTLGDAQKIVYRELCIWQEKQICDQMNCRHPEAKHSTVGFAARAPHEVPMPPLTDGLLAVILQRLQEQLKNDSRWDLSPLIEWHEFFDQIWSSDDDPITAVVMAFAQYLEARK